MDRSMPGLPVYHQLPKLTPTHVHWVSDAIQQPSHPLLPPFLWNKELFKREKKILYKYFSSKEIKEIMNQINFWYCDIKMGQW